MAYVYQTYDKDGKPHPRWKYRFSDHFGRLRKGTGTSSKKETIALAERREAFEKEIRDGVRKAPKVSDKAHDYEDLVSQYIAWGKTQGGRGGFGWSKLHGENRRRYLAWWKERLNLYTLRDISLAPVEKAMKQLSDAGKTSNTVYKYIEALSAFCGWCVSRQFLEADPLACMTTLKVKAKNPYRELTSEELRRLFEIAPPDRALWYRVALATGYRLSELRALKVRNLDLFGPSLPLSAEFCKNRKDARQPIPKALAEELKRLNKGKAPDASLLDMPTKDTVIEHRQNDFRKAGIVDNADGKAGLHSLRVNYINAVVRSGADLKTCMELARHSTPALTMQTYAKADMVRMRTAVEAVESYVQSAKSPIEVPQATGVCDGDPIMAEDERLCTVSEVITPLGFEPR
jgi:site-specific recombinase XerC